MFLSAEIVRCPPLPAEIVHHAGTPEQFIYSRSMLPLRSVYTMDTVVLPPPEVMEYEDDDARMA